MRLSTLSAITLLIVTPLSAQQGDSPARADVVSIKVVNQPDGPRRVSCGLPPVERTGGRIYIPFSQVCGLIRVAFDVADYQVSGIPADKGVGPSNFFEINVRVEHAGVPTMDETRLVVRTLLAERFKLRVRRESSDRPIYVLMATEDGPKLTPCSDPKARSAYTPGRITSCDPPIPMARLLQFFSSETGRPVFDKTGLEAPAFELRWLPTLAEPQPDSPPTFFTAIQEQLGLKLEPQRGPVDTMIVDSVEPPSPN
jgi:bla regulator protein blaR1